jgi:hypothetical protein
MATSNAFGGWLGEPYGHYETALSEYFFLVVVVTTLAQFAYDVFFNENQFWY